MVFFSKLLFFLIHLDQKTVFHWFGLEDSSNRDIYQTMVDGVDANVSSLEGSDAISIETFRLIVEGLWEKVQNGLTLGDIESVLVLILSIRFIILAFRYNLKTSFYITCIGLLAGYLWYRHLIDLIVMYRSVLLKLPFLHSLGTDALQLRSLNRQMALTEFKIGENAHWYNPGQVIYYAFTKGIVHIDPDTGLRYYIDPISMIISNLNEPMQSKVLPVYYKIYHKLIPKIFDICGKFWTQLSGVAAYAVITRIGKRYCPYLVRWHWTFLLIIGMMEPILTYFIYRVYYFQTFVLIPQLEQNQYWIDSNLVLQIHFLNYLIAWIVLAHIGLILFGMLHAIWGQYFYFPFFVENTELHIGPRPKNSIYSGGQTAWQEPKEKNMNRFFPKLWFGWFGRGSNNNSQLVHWFKMQIKKCLKILQNKFRK
jgi:Uncharacterised protein family